MKRIPEPEHWPWCEDLGKPATEGHVSEGNLRCADQAVHKGPGYAQLVEARNGQSVNIDVNGVESTIPQALALCSVIYAKINALGGLE